MRFTDILLAMRALQHTKAAEIQVEEENASDKAEQYYRNLKSVMNQIYEENPSYWPYGLSPEHFKGKKDSLWLLEDDKGNDVGFAGWYTVNGDREGQYSIGILPRYRKQGIGKTVVKKVVDKKKPTVDRVSAFIVNGNQPSISLAKDLGIRYHH